jgi:hypothetical protein
MVVDVWPKTCKIVGQNTHLDKRDTTTLHKERHKTTAQHGSNTTWQQHNLVAKHNAKHPDIYSTSTGAGFGCFYLVSVPSLL